MAHATRRSSDSSLDQAYRNVSHLYRRAGFGATQKELPAAARAGVTATVSALVDYDNTPDPFDPPPEATSDLKTRQASSLQIWWLNRMLTTTRPLQEKMVLFWHGHFATGIEKVDSPHLMYVQNATFRANALGRFDDILTAMYRDPAMLIWLDGQRNTKAAPNENWGREVLELFSLGRGNYSEDDIHANARAFTGWRLDVNHQAVFVPRLHDTGTKTLLGQTGPWGADDAVRIIAAHPATGPFLATKLWRFFASDTPPASVVSRLGQVYYASNHSIREVVRALFSSPEFYANAARTTHIKSPAEFIVSTLRQLGMTSPMMDSFPRTLLLMGQVLFDPPNVGGWPGGPTWINAGTMLERFNFASRLTGDSPQPGQINTAAILTASQAETMEQLAGYLAGVLGVESLSPGTRMAILRYAGTGTIDRADVETRIRGIIHLLLISPEYQTA